MSNPRNSRGGLLIRFWLGTCHPSLKHTRSLHQIFENVYSSLVISNVRKGIAELYPYTKIMKIDTYRSLYQSREKQYRSLYQNRENLYPSRWHVPSTQNIHSAPHSTP